MTDHFPAFAKLVADQFQKVTRAEAYVVDIDPDTLWEAYLAAFPEGSDPIFEKKTEHDCSCCRGFIRRAGNVVSVNPDGTLSTIWQSALSAPFPYNVVAERLDELVLGALISDLFRVSMSEGAFGNSVTHSAVDGKARTWHHFFTRPIDKRFKSATPDKARGDYRTTVQVYTRGLEELSLEAVETVLGLIDSDNLYRGAEHRKAVVAFRDAKLAYAAQSTPMQKNRLTWVGADSAAARFRNTVIGTLVQDLSEDKPLEGAVGAFESKVAPSNYKRTTALVTPAMVKKAMETIHELDLEDALERRFARVSDISINDVLWADSSVKPAMKGGIGDVLMQHATRNAGPADASGAEDVTIDAFMQTVLPKATGVEVLLKGEHLSNLMSLTAPVKPEPKRLFRWDNDFAWSYAGAVADSIKERVKKAGGKVDGAALRVSLSWTNFDDLDLHVVEPNGQRIWFRDKRSPSGGFLDVDMNAGGGQTREPVENVAWTKNPPNGTYAVHVNNYSRRETDRSGYVIEVECGGKLQHISKVSSPGTGITDHVCDLVVDNGVITKVTVGQGFNAQNISQEKWGLTTERFVKVNLVTLSPNFWSGNEVGNKHTFFVLDGAKNDEPTRGFFNEFLNPRLEPHRKVFELIADKTKCQPTEGQLSGLGFSSTKRDAVVVKVTQGKKQRLFNVQF